jgi:hypothetical protein
VDGTRAELRLFVDSKGSWGSLRLVRTHGVQAEEQ